MSKIIGATVGTPMNPDKLVPPVDKIKEAVNAYMDEHPVEGTPGKDGESTIICSTSDEINSNLLGSTVSFSFLWTGNETLFEYETVSGTKRNVTLYNGGLYYINRLINGAIKDFKNKGNLNGKDGANAELYGIKGYTVKSNADILNLCEKYPNSHFLVVNTGDTFTAETGTKNLVVSTGDICSVTTQIGIVVDIIYLDSSPISPEEATMYHWTEINENGVGVDRYAAVINGNSGGGAASGSDEYELINSITLTATDLEKDATGWQFAIDKDGKPYSLKAFTCFCYIPVAAENSEFEVSLMRSDTVAKGIHKRDSVLSTSVARYIRITAKLEGYWVASSMMGDEKNAVEEYGTWARNKLTEKISYIRLSAKKPLPVGTTFEVYGVRA